MARISSKNQITIPVAVLRELGLEPGDDVDVASIDGHVELHPKEDVIEKWAGSMPGVWPDGAAETVRKLRDEWDR